MATAPKVKKGGHDAARQRREAAQKVLKVTLPDDYSFTIAPNNVPTLIRWEVADQLGRSLEDIGDQPGVHTYAALWWVSRLVSGERISWAAAAVEWDERWPGLTIGELSTKVVDAAQEAADSPEA